MNLKESESEFQTAIIELAHYQGWLVEHKRPAHLEDGRWITPIQGDVGGPDLILARAGVVYLVELKSQKGKLTPEQELWQKAANTEIWRPGNWEYIEALLTAPVPETEKRPAREAVFRKRKKEEVHPASFFLK